MRINLKVILLSGLALYAVMFVIGMVSGMVLHEGVLEPIYKAHQEFWRPELNAEPPDMAGLMPRWITVGLLMAFLWAAIYDNIRSAFDGSAVVKGMKFGVVLGLIYGSAAAGWSGIFNLPDALWFWWSLEGFFNYIVGGAVLGWVSAKFTSD